MSKLHRVFVIAGISGVGKSFLISRLQKRNSGFKHYSAGTLIKKRLATIDRDELRKLSDDEILQNQYLLIDQLNEELSLLDEGSDVLFDAHMIIDSKSGRVDIPLDIFELMKPAALVLLKEQPRVIQGRRKNDGSRNRPERSIAELAAHQDKSELMASDYSSRLNIPFGVFTSSDIDGIEAFISNI